MGIFIHLSISKSVTRKEWEDVYAESLQLVKAFPLAERRSVQIKGIDIMCLARTEEHEYPNMRGEVKVGWCADGDYETLCTAEEYFLQKDLIDEVESDVEDALVGALPAYLDYSWEDPRLSHMYRLWGDKTQGGPYHISLLAVACLIEDRLQEKAFVYGDITGGQCRKAVEMANKHLVKPIDVPARCDMDRLYKRISKLSVTPHEQVEIFETFYLDTKDAAFGEFLRNTFSAAICREYWEERFEKISFGTVGFMKAISNYLLWGFDLEELCRLAGGEDKENFVKYIMDTKLHLKNKNCKDVLEIDQEESSPYSIYSLLGQAVFAGARNRKVDRYVPLEEIRKVLKKGLAGCNVDSVIDGYLENEKGEQDASELLQQGIDEMRQKMIEENEKYDIISYEGLQYYENGDIIHPELEKSVKNSFAFYHGMTKEASYSELMEGLPDERCKWLIDNNKAFLLRDTDWEKIFVNIEENPQSFARYYPMMQVAANSDNLIYMIKAFVLNDALYEYCKALIA